MIRDHEGKVIIAFAKNIGHSTTNKAEVWALHQGLNKAVNMKISHLLVDTDSQFLISCFLREKMQHSNLETLVMDVTRIIQGMGKVHLRFCYRETNAAADFLA